jgi:hypothetical protein
MGIVAGGIGVVGFSSRQARVFSAIAGYAHWKNWTNPNGLRYRMKTGWSRASKEGS